MKLFNNNHQHYQQSNFMPHSGGSICNSPLSPNTTNFFHGIMPNQSATTNEMNHMLLQSVFNHNHLNSNNHFGKPVNGNGSELLLQHMVSKAVRDFLAEKGNQNEIV
jgi:hypothetical protein